MKNFSKQNYLTLFLSLCLIFSISNLSAQKKEESTTRPVAVEKVCEQCCDCENLKPNTKAYRKSNCKMLAPLCEEIKKSGTGPVVVGGSKNEYASSGSCVCGQRKGLSTQKMNYILVGFKGLKHATKLYTSVEVFDKKGQQVYSSKGKTFDAFIMNKNQRARKVKNVSQIKLAANQNTFVNLPIELNAKAAAGQGKIKIIFFSINSKTKKRIILKKYNKPVQINSTRGLKK